MRMPARFGWGNAMRYLLTGDPFAAPEALRLGLVQEVVDTGQQVPRALELADKISKQAPLGIDVVLRTARATLADGEQAAVALATQAMPRVLSSEDAREGMMSLMEKREARFVGT